MATEENEDLEQQKTDTINTEEKNKDDSTKKPRRKKSTRKKTAKKKTTTKKSTTKKEDEQTTFSLDMLIAGLLILSVLLNFYMFYQSGQLKAEIETLTQQIVTQKQGDDVTTPTNTGSEAGDKAELTFYVMSQCPYGTQVLDAISPVLKQAGDYVDFKVDYIVTEQSDGSFRALHGQTEVDGNIVQLCAAKYHPQDYEYMDMIVCMDENAGNIPDNWENCARQAGLDVEKIRACYEGQEGKKLLSESAQRAQEAQASGSPTIYLNGQKYGGGRSSQDFLRAICRQLDEKPSACDDLPEEPKFQMVVLSDERCTDCTDMVERITPQLKQLFPGMSVKELDYSSTEGKTAYDSNNVQYLPAFLFPEGVEQASNYAQISRYLKQAGDYQSLAVGSEFDPTKEICDNEKDDTGNGQIDCEDPDCEESLVCREEKPQHLAVFVMSECPYGTRALDAMNEVLANFKDNMSFQVNYIASYNEQTDSFSALHGQSEVDENIRQLCAAKYYPQNNKYMQYIWCRDEDITNPDWESCAQMADLDEEKIAECAQGEEGKELLKENIKIAESLGIGASPTWLVNNKYTFSGITAEVVKTNFCQYNEGVSGCENTLTAQSDIPAGGC